MANDVVIKLTKNIRISAGNFNLFDGTQFLYSSTKEIADKVAYFLINNLSNHDFFKEGITARILEPGKNWVTGKIRLRFVVEFIPDKPESNNKTGEFGSILDDIRNRNL